MTIARVGYGACVLLGFVVAFGVKRAHERRFGAPAGPHARALSVAALIGAAIGAKIGMVLYMPPSEVLSSLAAGRFIGDGKTVIGAIAGGFLAVELAKRRLGVHARTGDAYSVALPVGVGIGRFGCAIAGCCYGRPSEGPLAIYAEGALRHPAPLYEATALLALGAVQHSRLGSHRNAGDAFRETLAAMALIRLIVDAFRGDPMPRFHGFSAAQVACGVAFVALALQRVRDRRPVRA